MPLSFVTTDNNFYFHILEKSARQLTETGITQWMIYKTFGPKFVSTYKNGPVVLKVGHLRFGFVIILSFLGVSFAVFLCEILITVVQRKLRLQMLNLFVLLSLRAHLERIH